MRRNAGEPSPSASLPANSSPALPPEDPPTAPLRPRVPPRALRPREKLYSRGAGMLSLSDLLCLVLGSGTRREPVTRIAERLARQHGLKGMLAMDPRGWRAQQGLGRASAAKMCAVFELGRRAYGRDRDDERPRVTRPREAYRQVRHLARAKKEHLVGLYLDAQSGLLHQETISIGSLNTTRTHPREILYPAVVHLAAGFILVHNHPSGSLEPSPEDVDFTHGVQRAAELMGIDLYDHLIVSRRGYSSLRERGVL